MRAVATMRGQSDARPRGWTLRGTRQRFHQAIEEPSSRGPRAMPRCRVDVPRRAEVDETGTPRGGQAARVVRRAVGVVRRGGDDRVERQALRCRYSERREHGRQPRVPHVGRGDEERSGDGSIVKRAPPRDGGHSERVRDQDRRHRAAHHRCVELRDPSRAIGCVPVAQVDPPRVGQSALPKGLPVRGAGIAVPRHEKDGGFHTREV